MSILSEQACEACEADHPKVSAEEAEHLLSELDAWEIIDNQGIRQLSKVYCFDNFVDALAFTKRMGDLAESVNHHPTLLTEWGQVTVRWWTHDIAGLHKNDFVLAAKTDKIFWLCW